ncbi:MAG: dihydroorotate dehydrogenase electron transfer subunit [Oscillospiraceae bacterium]|nr:dihydroorotate dehydrogenase electron transfer subunit [Oscillospiraceae bacterium]
MKQGIFTVEENRPLTGDVYEMTLLGDCSAFTGPGQFLNIRLEGKFLRRPISVCCYEAERVTILYKILGSGTAGMTALRPGDRLDVLTGLGKGFDTAKSGPAPLLVAGGVGLPPIYGLCRALLAEGKRPTVILGFNRAEDIFYFGKFEALGLAPVLCTADGSAGKKGLVTDAMAGFEDYTYLYACGPTAMLRGIDALAHTGGQYSLEARMGCGFGACMGCTIETRSGPKRVCREGPVFDREELLW